MSLFKKKNRPKSTGMKIFRGVLVLAMLTFGYFLLKSFNSKHETLIDHAAFVVNWAPHRNLTLYQYNRPDSITPGTNDNSPIYDHHWMLDGSLLRVPFVINNKKNGYKQMSNSVERLDPITGAITFTHSLSLRSVQRSSLYDPAVSPDGKKMFLEDLGDIALLNLETGANRILKRGGDGRNFQSVVAATYYECGMVNQFLVI